MTAHDVDLGVLVRLALPRRPVTYTASPPRAGRLLPAALVAGGRRLFVRFVQVDSNGRLIVWTSSSDSGTGSPGEGPDLSDALEENLSGIQLLQGGVRRATLQGLAMDRGEPYLWAGANAWYAAVDGNRNAAWVLRFDDQAVGTTVAADAGGPYRVLPGGTVELNGSASVEMGEGRTTYAWEIVTGGGSLVNANTATPTYTPPVLEPGTGTADVVLRLTATNNRVSGTDDAALTAVAPDQTTVVATAGGPYTVDAGDDVMLDGGGDVARPFGPTTHSWEILTGVGGSLDDRTLEDPRFQSPDLEEGDVDREFRLRYTRRNHGVEATAVAEITVRAPALPAIHQRQRQFRYALFVPARGESQAFAFWTGAGRLALAGVMYEPGQWASYEDRDPVSGFLEGDIADNVPTLLAFRPDGVFDAWLSAGDQITRQATLMSLASEGAQWQPVKSSRGELGMARPGNDGVTMVEFLAKPQPSVRHPVLLQALAAGDTFDRFLPKIEAGVKVGS